VTPDEDIPATDSPTPFSFTDAAEWVMDTFGHKMPMHYRDIVALALSMARS
jgi:hypothetical protein